MSPRFDAGERFRGGDHLAQAFRGFLQGRAAGLPFALDAESDGRGVVRKLDRRRRGDRDGPPGRRTRGGGEERAGEQREGGQAEGELRLRAHIHDLTTRELRIDHDLAEDVTLGERS